MSFSEYPYGRPGVPSPPQSYYPSASATPAQSTLSVKTAAAVLGGAAAIGAALFWLDRKHSAAIESVNRGLASALASAAAAEVTAVRSAAAFKDLTECLPLSPSKVRVLRGSLLSPPQPAAVHSRPTEILVSPRRGAEEEKEALCDKLAETAVM